MISIKNVILYDHYQHVVGFVELKNIDQETLVKIKHNLDVTDLILSITVRAENFAFKMGEKNFSTSIKKQLDIDAEVVVAIMQKAEDDITTLASGIINPAGPFKMGQAKDGRMPLADPPEDLQAVGALKSILQDTQDTRIDRQNQTAPKTKAAREIDEVLRAVCTINDQGKGMCETCPYRDHFFGESNVLTCNEKHVVIKI